jgi:hypothetical protein
VARHCWAREGRKGDLVSGGFGVSVLHLEKVLEMDGGKAVQYKCT